MVKQAANVKKAANKFNGLENSPALQAVEKIYGKNEENRQERIAQQEPSAQTQVVEMEHATPLKTPAKKTQNGITIYVPMEYYMQIIQLKMETGTPIKDIALQAVIEYLERRKG